MNGLDNTEHEGFGYGKKVKIPDVVSEYKTKQKIIFGSHFFEP